MEALQSLTTEFHGTKDLTTGLFYKPVLLREATLRQTLLLA